LSGYGTHDRGCLLVNASAELGSDDHIVTEVTEGLFAVIEESFSEAIRRGQREGEFNAARNADLEAGSLLTTVVGASLLLKARTDGQRVKRAIDSTLDGL
jgi:TetR/AcrR family transcriptional repressor of nem operon